jgi:hypothetical protein
VQEFLSVLSGMIPSIVAADLKSADSETGRLQIGRHKIYASISATTFASGTNGMGRPVRSVSVVSWLMPSKW